MTAYRFDFVVSELTEKQCDRLMDIINTLVERSGGRVGGGFSEDLQEDGDDEILSES